MIQIAPGVQLDESEIEERFIRSRGPGGQNVNKVASAVQLRFAVRRSASLPARVRNRLCEIAANRINNEGELVITADSHRSQQRNRAAALARLVHLIERANFVPKPRKATRPSAGSKRRRLEQKRRRSDVKKGRGRVAHD